MTGKQSGQPRKLQSTPAHRHRVLELTPIISTSSNAYYFWNSKSNETTWENPFSAAAAPTTTAQPPLPTEDDRFDGIDPDLAYLDPKYSTATSSASASYAPTFQARFNSRTGRFQGDPTINPDRVSEFKRGERQQEAFYDTNSWTESLGGKGLRAARGIGGSTNEEGVQTKQKRPSAKQVVSCLSSFSSPNTLRRRYDSPHHFARSLRYTRATVRSRLPIAHNSKRTSGKVQGE